MCAVGGGSFDKLSLVSRAVAPAPRRARKSQWPRRFRYRNFRYDGGCVSHLKSTLRATLLPPLAARFALATCTRTRSHSRALVAKKVRALHVRIDCGSSSSEKRMRQAATPNTKISYLARDTELARLKLASAAADHGRAPFRTNGRTTLGLLRTF